MDKKGCRNTEKPEEFCKFAEEDVLSSESETATRGSMTENDIPVLQKCIAMDEIILGQIVISNAGHDRDSHLVANVIDAQNRIVTYQFNNAGQAVSIRNPEGEAVFMAYNSADRTKTQLAAVSKTQTTVFNLLKNRV